MPVVLDEHSNQLNTNGYSVFNNLFAPEACATIAAHIAKWQTANGLPTHAARAVLASCPGLRNQVLTPAVWECVHGIAGPGARLVKSLFFDKPPGQVWKVPPHQDVTLAMASRRNVPGFGPWTRKANVWHTQPPGPVLAGVLKLRIHLDAQTAANGALRVWPGTHTHGKLADDAIAHIAQTQLPVVVEAPAGSALIMRPLLVHASHSHTAGLHRRVVHLEFWAGELPNGLEFNEQ